MGAIQAQRFGSSFTGRLGAQLPLGGERGSTIQVQAFFPSAPSDPHLFSKSLEFELRSLVA